MAWWVVGGAYPPVHTHEAVAACALRTWAYEGGGCMCPTHLGSMKVVGVMATAPMRLIRSPKKGMAHDTSVVAAM